MKLQDFFMVDTRPDGETFTRLTEYAPDWLRSAIYKAHDGCMSDDCVYDICRQVAFAIDGGAESADDVSWATCTTSEAVDALLRLRLHDDVAGACHSSEGPDHENLWYRVSACFEYAQRAIGQRFFDAVKEGHL